MPIKPLDPTTQQGCEAAALVTDWLAQVRINIAERAAAQTAQEVSTAA